MQRVGGFEPLSLRCKDIEQVLHLLTIAQRHQLMHGLEILVLNDEFSARRQVRWHYAMALRCVINA